MVTVVTINTYAGSLLEGARLAGVPVLASLEDAGYGVATQRANFPAVPVHQSLPWPDLDLRSSVVVAHPPCAPFSAAGSLLGLNDPRVACHRRAMEYGMSRGALAVAVESVPRALTGAWLLHEAIGSGYGYHRYRVLQDASSFGVPQARRRFWIVFSREPRLILRPPCEGVARVADKLGHHGQLPKAHEGKLEEQFAMLSAWRDPGVARSVLSGRHGFRRIGRVIKDAFGLSRREGQVGVVLGAKYDDSTCHILDPDGLAPTLLPSSWWIVPDESSPLGARSLTLPEYSACMGFPPSYIMPPSRHREYLSRGVCPPVAAWLIGNLCDPPSAGVELKPGEVLDCDAL